MESGETLRDAQLT